MKIELNHLPPSLIATEAAHRRRPDSTQFTRVSLAVKLIGNTSINTLNIPREEVITHREIVNDIARNIHRIGKKIPESYDTTYAKALGKIAMIKRDVTERIAEFTELRQIELAALARDEVKVSKFVDVINDITQLTSPRLRKNSAGGFTSYYQNISDLTRRLWDSNYRASAKQVKQEYHTNRRKEVLLVVTERYNKLTLAIAAKKQSIANMEAVIEKYQSYQTQLDREKNWFQQPLTPEQPIKRVKRLAPQPPSTSSV